MPTMLVLGATSGIARATARAFAGSGWTLQLAGRDIQRLQEVADDCGGASIFPFDALDPASRSALWGLLPSCPDAVLCAVGLLGDQDCACRDPKAALQVIECNFTGLVPVLLQAAEAFETRGSGLLIGLSSVAGIAEGLRTTPTVRRRRVSRRFSPACGRGFGIPGFAS